MACPAEPTVPIPGPTDTATEPPTDEVGTFVGSWAHVDGPDIFDAGLDDLTYLVFSEPTGEAGTFEVLSVEAETGAPDCVDGVYASITEGSIQISIGRTGYVSEQTLAVLATEGQQLTVTTPEGTATFEAIEAVPAASQCGRATVVQSFEVALPSQPYGYYVARRGSLLFDGTNLQVFWADGLVYPVDPTDGTIGTPQALDATYATPIAIEGQGIWARSSQAVGRLDPVPVIIDIVDTAAPYLKVPIFVDAGVHDGTNLILNGFGGNVPRLLVVNATAEPDLLVSEADSGIIYDDLTLHRGDVWGLTTFGNNPVMVRIDPTTGRGLQTVRLPAGLPPFDVEGLESTGSNLFVLVVPYDSPQLYEIAIP